MSSKKNVVTSGAIYTLGSLLIQGLAFITLPIYTRIISKDVYGAVNLYNAWVGLFSLFIGLQTGGSFSSARIKFPHSEYKQYVRTALSVTNIFFGLVLALSFMLRSQLATALGLSPLAVTLLIFQSYFSYLTGFLAQYFIQQQKANTTLIVSAFSAVSSVILSVSLIYRWEDDFMARIVGQFVPSMMIALGTLVYFYHRLEKPLLVKYVPFILTVSLPLIFHHLGHQLLNQLDRIMLGKMLTVSEVATYSFGYNVALVLQIVLGSINTAWVPWFFEAKKNNLAHLREVIIKYLAIGMFLTLGYLTIAPELAYLLGGASYQDSHGFIGMIVVSYFFVFLYTFPVNIQFYHANTRYIPVGTLFAAMINFLLNYLLIPTMGVYGSALATVLSYLCLLVFHHLLARRLYTYDDVSIKTYLCFSGLALAYTYLMNFFLGSWLIRWGIGLIVLLAYASYYRRDLISFIDSKFKIGGKA